MTDISPAAARLDAAHTVNTVLRMHRCTVSVFNALGIDACCGGERTLAQAARENGIQLDALLAALRRSLDDAELLLATISPRPGAPPAGGR